MDINQRIRGFSETGISLCRISWSLLGIQTPVDFSPAETQLYKHALGIANSNPWFTIENTAYVFNAIGQMLHPDKLQSWVEKYPALHTIPPKAGKIAVVMAGNIPLVGFHDFLCVLIAGHSVLGKLSSQDKFLPVALAQLLIEKEPKFSQRIAFSEGPIKGFDAIIATGSNNSARYFEYYFGKYPNIIRKNRSSVAVLVGNEDWLELEKLGEDVFRHFGLGCRNVSSVFLPRGYDLQRLIDAWQNWKNITDNHKYFNNYDYFKAVFMINQIPYYDSGFVLLRQNNALSSPVAVVNYQYYESTEEVMYFLHSQHENIQCIVSSKHLHETPTVEPGNSQKPELWNYADNIDTMQFLLNLNI